MNQLENLFLSLSDKTRLRLLGLMANGEVSVGYLADSLGESQPKISRHLAYLRNAGLVSTRRDGKWIYYGIEVPSDQTAANVLDATLGRAIVGAPPSAVADGTATHDISEPEPVFEERYQPEPVYEQRTPYEPDYAEDDDDWRPEEIEVYLL